VPKEMDAMRRRMGWMERRPRLRRGLAVWLVVVCFAASEKVEVLYRRECRGLLARRLRETRLMLLRRFPWRSREAGRSDTGPRSRPNRDERQFPPAT
jgi:hypothetical protein